jgi:DNA-binding GntR family transcriptional regulator
MAATLQRNASFHSLIARATGNERLVALIEKLLSEMPRLITAGYIKGEHEELMRALRQRNPQRARDAMRAHILAVKEKALGAAAPGSLRASLPPRGAVARSRARATPGRK